MQIDRNVANLMKLIASLFVAMCHFSWYQIDHHLHYNIINYLFALYGGYFGVAVFFFLSGYGLMKSEQLHHLDLVSFFKKRYLKIYLPILLLTILFIPLYSLCLYNGQTRSLLDLVIQFLGFSLIAPFFDRVLWFIPVLLCLYLLFYIYSNLRRKELCPSLVIGSMILLIIVLMYLIYNPKESYQIVSIPLFLIGILAADYDDKITVFLKNKVIFVLMALSLILLGTGGGIFYKKSLFLVSMNYLLILFFCWICSNNIIRIKKLPTFIAPISFSIYMIHNKVILTLNYFQYNSFVMFVVMTLLLSYIFSFILRYIWIKIS